LNGTDIIEATLRVEIHLATGGFAMAAALVCCAMAADTPKKVQTKDTTARLNDM
jgi:acyl-coenzyme A thioesterase PaaI-like protein